MKEKTLVVHHLVLASSFPSILGDLGFPMVACEFPIYSQRQVLGEEKTGQMNKCVGY